ncbi:TetR/AcrR family transcriptional regulator [Actinoplanes sp. CA-252034]|uniref:TetR/AcrR family transcriptional regulator n=1 Tax=Actinoplanes sp. CA-252034 TaxID=3239906 RepID=UPI003D96BD33
MSDWTDQSFKVGFMARTAAPGTRDTILTAAAGLFYEFGVRAVGMAQVVEAAGCGKNLLYKHFPSKADLAAAYLMLARHERERTVTEALRWSTDPTDRLLTLVTEIADTVRRPGYRGCAFRNYLTEFPGETDEPARIARAYLADSRAQMDRLVLGAGGDELLADRIWLVVNGLHSGTPAEAPVAVDWITELVRPAGAP